MRGLFVERGDISAEDSVLGGDICADHGNEDRRPTRGS